MGSNIEKKPWTNALNQYKKLRKEIKSDNFMGSNRTKTNIAIILYFGAPIIFSPTLSAESQNFLDPVLANPES